VEEAFPVPVLVHAAFDVVVVNEIRGTLRVRLFVEHALVGRRALSRTERIRGRVVESFPGNEATGRQHEREPDDGHGNRPIPREQFEEPVEMQRQERRRHDDREGDEAP